MRITEEEKQRLEKFRQRAERRKYLYEEKDRREIRKYNERYEKYNRDGGCVKAAMGATHNDAPHRYVKNEKGEWETENIIFKYHNKHKWEDRDEKHTKHKRNETCILYEDGRVMVVNATVETHHRELYDKYEPDKESNRIFITLPKYKMNFEVRKMRTFDRLPEKIIMDDEEFDREELLQAILQTGKSVYEIA